MNPETELLVEIWCPLTDFDQENSEEFFNGVEHYLDTKAHGLSAENFDDDEVGEHYVFAVWQASEDELLEVARRVAALPAVPSGTYALVTTVEKQLSGQGRRVELT